MCIIRLLGLVANLLFLIIHGTNFHSGIPSVDLVFACEKGAIVLHGLTYFHLMFFHQENFLHFFNFVKQKGYRNHSNSRNNWKKVCWSYIHFILVLAWLPTWNLSRFFLGNKIKDDAQEKWYMFILGARNPTEMKELEIWKLAVGFVLEILEWDVMNMAACSVVMIYSMTTTIQKIVDHLIKDLGSAGKYWVQN